MLLIVRAGDADEIERCLADDPWTNSMLETTRIAPGHYGWARSIVDPAYASGGSAGSSPSSNVTASIGLRPRELRWTAPPSSKVQRRSLPYAALPTRLYAM